MYSQRIGNQYEKLRWKTLSGREVEAAVLQKAALLFRRAQSSLKDGTLSPEAEEALQFNRRIWEVLRNGWTAKDCNLPDQIRENLLNLSIYMIKAEMDFRADPVGRRLNGLIQVNEALASGLEAQQRNARSLEPAGAHTS